VTFVTYSKTDVLNLELAISSWNLDEITFIHICCIAREEGFVLIAFSNNNINNITFTVLFTETGFLTPHLPCCGFELLKQLLIADFVPHAQFKDVKQSSTDVETRDIDVLFASTAKLNYCYELLSSSVSLGCVTA